MNSFLTTLAAAIVVVLGALFAVPHFVDWSSYRGVIEEEASRIIGRDVRIGESVSVRLLPNPSIRLSNVRIADTTALSGEPIISVGAVSARLSIAPLLRGILEVGDVELIRPVVRLVVDGAGGGNWQSLSVSVPARTFVPATITLSQVRISGGELRVLGPDGSSPRFTIGGIEGEISTAETGGPYRFKGAAMIGGQRHEARGHVTPVDERRNQRVALTARSASGATLTRFEGELSTPGGIPALNGELNMSSPYKIATSNMQKEVKSPLTADPRGAALSGLTVAFESAGRPQILSGGAQLSMGEDIELSGALSAAWLDLDRILDLGSANPEPPTKTLSRLANLLPEWFLDSPLLRALRFEVRQMALGGDAISDLVLLSRGRGNESMIEDLSASLPGGGRLVASGRLSVDRANDDGRPTSYRFAGPMTIEASSTQRLLNWATAGRATLDPASDGALATSATLNVSAATFALDDISANFGETVVRGTASYDWGSADHTVRIDLRGPVIDLRPFEGPAGTRASFNGLAQLQWLVERTAADRGSSLSLALKAGQLRLPGQDLFDLGAHLEADSGTLKVHGLDATTGDGAGLSLKGRFDRRRNPGVSHSFVIVGAELSGAISATTAEGLLRVASLFGLPESGWADTTSNLPILPLRLAGTLHWNQPGSPRALTITSDGMAADVAVTANVHLAENGSDWGRHPFDLTLKLVSSNNGSIAEIAEAMVYEWWEEQQSTRQSRTETRRSQRAARNAKTSQGAGIGQNQIVLHLTGVAAEDLHVTLDSRLNGSHTIFSGSMRPLEPERVIKGRLSVQASTAVAMKGGARPLFFLPQIPLDTLTAVPLNGSAEVRLTSSTTSLENLSFTVGSVTASGRIVITSTVSADKQALGTSLAGALHLTRLDTGALLTGVLSRPDSTSNSAVDGISIALGRSGAWSGQPFDFGALSGFDARLTLTADTIALPGAIAGRNARAVLLSNPDTLELKSVSANGMGGTFSGSVRLQRARSGAELVADVSLDKGDLEQLGGQGTVAGRIQLSGAGISPAALVANLAGAGLVTIENGTATAALGASQLKALIASSLEREPDQVASSLVEGLSAALAAEAIGLGRRQLALSADRGVLRTEPTSTTTRDGRTSLSGSLDLSTMTLHSVWQVESAMPPSPAVSIPLPPGLPPIPLPAQRPKPPLPMVTVTVSEPLAGLGRSDSDRRTRHINSEALQRELMVRKIERDLERLERIRLIDEELTKLRLRQEEERRQAELRALQEAETRARAEAEARARAEVDPSKAATAAARDSAQTPSETAASAEPASAQPQGPGRSPNEVPAQGSASETAAGAAAAAQQPGSAASANEASGAEPASKAATQPIVRRGTGSARPGSDDWRRRVFEGGG